MALDHIPNETAEQKAQRYWHNKQLLAKVELLNKMAPLPDIQPQPSPPQNSYIHQLHKFKRDIKAIVLERPTQILTQYIISIQAKKRKLLREKLKRLERNNECEL